MKVAGVPVTIMCVALCCAAFGMWQFLHRSAVQLVSVTGGKPAPIVARARLAPPPPPFEFPAGGRTLAGTYRFVALYGSPDSPALGVLGEQSPNISAVRAKELAATYQPLSAAPIYPTFEIISTIASATATD